MALPDAGNSISLKQVNVELSLTATAAINMGGSDVRGLFDVASGAIDMSDGYGKSDFVLELTASAASSANLKTLFDNSQAGSWADSTNKKFIIAANTTMGIITAPASMGGALEIALAGNIQGTGGAGGNSSGGAGAGGTAMTIQSTGITINMASGSTISGGAGGGGAGGAGGNGYWGSGCGQCTNGTPSGCVACCTSCCEGGENNIVQCFYNTTGGQGGDGGRGQGYGQSAANGNSGNGPSGPGNGSQAGAGGAGGNGASFGAAGAAGATGANGNTTNGASGSAGGAAGRAITFSGGVSAYTIIGDANGTINGAYT